MLDATGYPFTYTGVSPPVALTSTYNFPLSHDQFHSPTHPHTYYYARSQNPNFSLLSEQLKALHKGDDCVLFSSGMGAISATLFSLLSKVSFLFSLYLFFCSNILK
jgi:methionine-gamma-lyase